MASSLLALLDDIASILDDVAVLTKVATGKTAGVLGDDLALNAQQVTGVAADRELPVVWAVAKGSLKNKAILVPAALAISALAPWAITPLMIVGGLFLCFEGAEKVTHRLLHSRQDGRVASRGTGQGRRRSDGRPRGAREGQDQGCDPHRFHPVGRDHRDHARHGGDRGPRHARVRAGRHRDTDDGRRLRAGCGHREARRRRAGAFALAVPRLPAVSAAQSSPPRRGS